MYKKILSILLVAILIFSFIPFNTLVRANDYTLERLAGDNRYATAVEISKAGWNDGAQNVVLAYGKNFPDALAGAPLSYKLDAPMLLTDKDKVPEDTVKEIERLKATDIWILGGKGVISDNVVTQLKNKGLTVHRIAGGNRFKTAIAIGQELYNRKSFDTAVISTGYNFPDALGMGPIAAIKGYPILFTSIDTLNNDTKAALEKWNIKKVIIVGGTGVVSTTVENQLKAMGTIVERTAGSNRFTTAIEVAKNYSINPEGVLVATGKNFPDALAGGVLAAKWNMPILLSDKVNIKQEALDYIRKGIISKSYILGGTGVIGSTVGSSIKPMLSTNIGEGQMMSAIEEISESEAQNVEEDIVQITRSDNGGTQITLNESNNALGQLNVGDVFYMEPTTENPLGMAGKITAKRTEGSNTIITTTQPDITEVFDELDIEVERNLGQSDILDFQGAPGVSLSNMSTSALDYNNDIVLNVNMVLYDKDKNLNTTDDQVTLTGDLQLDNLKLYADIEKSLTSVESMDLDMSVDIYQNLELDIDALQASIGPNDCNYLGLKDSKFSIYGIDMGGKVVLASATLQLSPAPVVAGPGATHKTAPLGVTLMITATLDGEIDINATIEQSYATRLTADMGYRKGEDPWANVSTQPLTDGVEIDLGIDGEAGLTLGVGLLSGIVVTGIIPAAVTGDLLYDIGLDGSATLSGSSSGWNANGNITFSTDLKLISEFLFRLGMRADVGPFKWDESVEYNKTLWEKILWQYSKTWSSEERGNTTGNIVNGGFVAQEGDWIYYLNNNDDGLYKIKTDGSSRTRLNDDSSTDINVVGDWIYYRNYSDGSKIYKIKTDGSSRTRLNNDESYYINVVGDWIYYRNELDGGKIYKMKTDGSSRMKINDDDSGHFNVVGDWIYYSNLSDGYKIYKMKTDGSSRTRINDDNSSWINVVGDWIYYRNYSDGSKIYKIKTNGTNRIKINDDDSKFVNVVGDWIYYNNVSDGGSIYKIKTDGTNRTKVNDDDSWFVNVVGDWIYYLNNSDDLKMYKIKTDGTNRLEVNSVVEDYIEGDTYISEYHPGENFNNYPVMKISNHQAIDWRDKILIKFDITKYLSNASSAKIRLYYKGNPQYGNDNAYPNNNYATKISAYNITESWDSNNVTWNSRPSTNPVAISTVSTVFPQSTDGSYVEIDITDLYKNWKSGAVINNGIEIRGVETFQDIWYQCEFVTSDNTDYPQYHPQLIVE